MRYLALATDYDGTLADNGRVEEETVAALRRLAATGRKLILVTGRQLPDLQQVFPQYTLFDCILAENGAVVFTPSTSELRTLAEPPSPRLVAALRQGGIEPLYTGQVVVATVEPNAIAARKIIDELGLDHRVILNKGSVMILPSAINKASGLRTALEELHIRLRDVVSVGDAENDEPLLEMAGFGVAVANALDSVKARADLVTDAPYGAGVVEVINWIVEHAG